jgi:hypothetical protein
MALDNVQKYISNLIENQFPEVYVSDGPLFVAFVVAYYRWMEERSAVKHANIPHMAFRVEAGNATVNVSGASIRRVFSNGDVLAIYGKADDYSLFTVNTTASNTRLTIYPTPEFTNLAANVANTKVTANPIYNARRMFEYNNIDETPAEFVVYFKEKYLKDIQFNTNTNIRELIKHSLDIYRSKGTERSVDLLFRLVFGTGAEIYYPGQDVFRLSDGEWVIPTYLEVTLAHWNVNLIGKQIIGMRSGAKGYVESAVRRTVAGRLVDVLYISPIFGSFRTGEVIDTEDRMLQRNRQITHVIGSLSNVALDVYGSGSGFQIGQTVDLTSIRGREGRAYVTNTVSTTGLVNFDLINGGYGYSSKYSEVLVSERVLTMSNVISTTNATSYFTIFDKVVQPLANITFTGAYGLQSNRAGNVSITSNSTFLVGVGTAFGAALDVGDDIGVYTDAGEFEIREVISISNATYLQVNSAFTVTNTETKYAKRERMVPNTFIYNYYSNGSVAGAARILSIQYTNAEAGEMRISMTSGNVEPVVEFNANLTGNVVLIPNTRIVIGATPSTNVAGTVRVAPWKSGIIGTDTLFDKDFIYASANLVGTVSVNTTSVNVTGIGTAFNTDFSNGSYLTVHANDTHYESRRINAVTNSTHLRLDNAFATANATADYSRGYKRSFITAWMNSSAFEIRTLNSIVNSTFLTLSHNFSFNNAAANVGYTVDSGTQFLIPNANQTGTVSFSAACTTVTATGASILSDTFIVGDSIALWHNTTAHTIRTINSIPSATVLTLTTPPEVTNTAAKFANVDSNSAVLYGTSLSFMTNSTASVSARINAVVNSSYLTLQTTLSVNNSEVTLANSDVAENLYYSTNTVTWNVASFLDQTATGNVIGVSGDLIIRVSNVSGTFVEEEPIIQRETAVSSNADFGNGVFSTYTLVTPTTGVLRMSNTAGAIKTGYQLVGALSEATAIVDAVEFNIGVIDVENTFRNEDWAFYYTTTGYSNGYVKSISSGSGATFGISNDLIYGTNVLITNAYIRDFLGVPLSAISYLMDGDPDGNLTSNTIYNIIGYEEVEFGKIYALTNINNGDNYTAAPFVRIYDPRGAAMTLRDDVLSISGATAQFTPGEVVRQIDTGARGIVKTGSNTTILSLERLYINETNEFIPTVNVTTQIIGDDSGSVANIVSIGVSSYSHLANELLGLNANVATEVFSANGSVTSLRIVASGYGFANGEQVTFSNGESSGNGIAIVSTAGIGSGYYRNTGGFLSDSKKLFDGHYYQQYSYVVRSKLTLNRYEEMLRKVLHVLGTKYYAEFIHAATANSSTSISTTLTTE